MIKLKRAYDDAEKSDGARVLIDRLWPRGVSKERAKLDAWFKDVAPSTELRKWFNHDVKNWIGFKRKYLAELKKNKDGVSALRSFLRAHKTTTFVYADHDTEHSHAILLKEFLTKK